MADRWELNEHGVLDCADREEFPRLHVRDGVLHVNVTCYEDHVVKTEIPLADVTLLLASTPAGRVAMASALRAAGWTCCEPGAPDIFVVTDDTGLISTEDGHMAAFYTQDAAVEDLEPGECAVRYIRCAPAPTGGGNDQEPGPRGGE